MECPPYRRRRACPPARCHAAAWAEPALGDYKRTTYDGCTWENWGGGVVLAAKPNAAAFPSNGFGGTVVRDCWANIPTSATATVWMQPVIN